MAATKSFPNRAADADGADVRFAQGGQMLRHTTGAVRSGVLWRGSPTLIGSAAGAPLRSTVVAFVACSANDLGDQGAMLGGNDAPMLVSHDAAPASGRRIDVVYHLMRDTQQQDGSSIADVLVARGGATTGTPVRPALPARAVELGEVEISSGTTSTTQAGAVYRQTSQFTTAAGGVLVVRTIAERDALTGLLPAGTVVYVVASSQTFVLDGVPLSWVHVSGRGVEATITYQGVFKADVSNPASVFELAGEAGLDGVISTVAAQVAATSYPAASIPQPFWPAREERFSVSWGDTGHATITVSTSGVVSVRFFTAPGDVQANVLRVRLSGCRWRLARVG